MPALTVISCHSRLRAMWRKTAKCSAAWPARTRRSSSRKATSSTQWSRFSIRAQGAPGPRTAAAIRAGSAGRLVRWERTSVLDAPAIRRSPATAATLAGSVRARLGSAQAGTSGSSVAQQRQAARGAPGRPWPVPTARCAAGEVVGDRLVEGGVGVLAGQDVTGSGCLRGLRVGIAAGRARQYPGPPRAGQALPPNGVCAGIVGGWW